MSQERRGFIFGVSAYLIWGAFPLYLQLLTPANAVEILAQRMVWTFLIMVVIVWRMRLWPAVRAVFGNRRQLRLLTIAAVAISLNWGFYIYAVGAGQVAEASFGYFINPLMTIVVGVFVLGERLRLVQWIAVGISVVAIVVIAVGYGQLPWIALILAISFTIYGLMKKQAEVGAAASLTVETSVLFLPALVTLFVLGGTGRLAFGHHGVGNAALLAGAGLYTAIPLLLFAAATSRLPLSQVGLIQYLTPILQLIVAVAIDHERVTASRWAGFGLVWLALLVLIVDGLRAKPREREPAATP
jgi:chloramphenicol-sensitive protein RarD